MFWGMIILPSIAVPGVLLWSDIFPGEGEIIGKETHFQPFLPFHFGTCGFIFRLTSWREDKGIMKGEWYLCGWKLSVKHWWSERCVGGGELGICEPWVSEGDRRRILNEGDLLKTKHTCWSPTIGSARYWTWSNLAIIFLVPRRSSADSHVHEGLSASWPVRLEEGEQASWNPRPGLSGGYIKWGIDGI